MIFLALLSCSSLFSSFAWSSEKIITFEKEGCTGLVGQVVTMRCLVPANTLSLHEIEESLPYDPFFSRERGVATFLSLTQEGSFLLLSFIPRGVGEGVSLFASMRRHGTVLSWTPFTYAFSLPMPPLFSYPMLDRFMNPLIPSSHPLLAEEMNSLLEKQKKSFEVQEEARALFWNALLVVTCIVLIIPYEKEWWMSLIGVLKDYKAKRKKERLLREAVRKKQADWSLLLRYLLLLHTQEEEMAPQTALGLASFFQAQGKDNLAQAAQLIDRYGYLPGEHFEQFLKAYSLVGQGFGNMEVNHIGGKP